MTPDQRLRRTYPYVAELPERPRGYGQEYDAIHEWLVRRLGSPLGGRWYLLGLRAYFAREADCAAFVEAWGVQPAWDRGLARDGESDIAAVALLAVAEGQRQRARLRQQVREPLWV